jgi:hypothetical protein
MPKIEALTSADFETREPNVLFWDLENSPNVGYTWGKWQQNVIEFVDEWRLLSFSVKRQNGKQITKCLADYEGYDHTKPDDTQLVKELWSHLDKADILIAHNGDRFDIRKAYTRFIELGLDPPRPAKSVDTLKQARKLFAFNSNKLDDLGRRLGVGRKIQTGGFELWRTIIQTGDPKAWNRMKKYNAADVKLLESVYNRMLPYMTAHPNINVITNREFGCPKCASTNVQHRGFHYTPTGKARRFQCNDCKGYSTGKRVKTTDIR